MKFLRVTCCLFVLLLSLVAFAFVAVRPAVAQELNPPPPLPGAICSTRGQDIICQGSFTGPDVNIISGSCDSFQVLQNDTGIVRFTLFYTQEGNATKWILHERFVGTLSNSVTGTSVPFEAAQTVTATFAPPGDVPVTITITGLTSKVTLPGSGLILHDVGKIVFTPDGTILSVHGPRFILDQIQRLCAALS